MGKFALFALTLGALAHPARSADDLIASEMVHQAREWQQKNRDDLAAVLWRKLLRANPQHPEALVKLGVIEARAGNLRAAQELYNRASQLIKPPIGLNALSIVLKTDQSSSPDLTRSLPKSKPEQSKFAPLKPEVSPPAPLTQVEPGVKTTPGKPLRPKAVVPSAGVSKKKSPVVALSAPSVADASMKPVQKTEVDALNLTFSNSMEIAR